ncbi:hypothetical protein [Flavivirga aquatica]|uniref:hypothetical protein n=1 Tax=Flavivirga aquatica TaxID=1849968 RepID=UPI0013F4D451|nr:hypothetical protein [Flavivirga aquatica]
MKKITLIILTVFLNVGLFSCSPETVTENNNPQEQLCCDEEGPIIPPPTKD